MGYAKPATSDNKNDVGSSYKKVNKSSSNRTQKYYKNHILYGQELS